MFDVCSLTNYWNIRKWSITHVAVNLCSTWYDDRLWIGVFLWLYQIYKRNLVQNIYTTNCLFVSIWLWGGCDKPNRRFWLLIWTWPHVLSRGICECQSVTVYCRWYHCDGNSVLLYSTLQRRNITNHYLHPRLRPTQWRTVHWRPFTLIVIFYITETEYYQPLPPPKAAADTMKNSALKAIHTNCHILHYRDGILPTITSTQGCGRHNEEQYTEGHSH